MAKTALIVEDDTAWIGTLADELGKCGLAADCAQSRPVAIRKLKEGGFRLVTIDPFLPPNGLADGFAVLDYIREMQQRVPRVLVISGYDPLTELAQRLVHYMPVVDGYFGKGDFDKGTFATAVAKIAMGADEAVRRPKDLLLIDVPRQRISSVCPGRFSDVPVPAEIVGHLQRMKQFVEEHPYDRNVFVMMRYRQTNVYHRNLITQAVQEHGFYPVLADETALSDDLYNPLVCLLCCRLGIALFDQPEPQQVVNPNVMYELGMMHILGRETLLLKNDALGMPSDILLRLYVPYNDAYSEQIYELVAKWLRARS